MQPVCKPPFTKFVKKQHAPVQLAIADAVDQILEDPTIGEKKVGDLKGVSVFKFSLANVEYLIAYRPHSEVEKLDEGVDIELLHVDFYKVGRHENFYLDLKMYLKSVGTKR